LKKGLVVDREAKYIGVYVPDEDKIYTGIPRRKVLKKTKIYAGDKVLGKTVDSENFIVEDIEERKNLDFLKPATSVWYLKVLSVSRIFLDNFDNIQTSHVTQTMKVGPVGLHFGANDLGSTMIEENVVTSTGLSVSYPKPEKMAKIIKEAGFKPAQRDTYYNIVKYFD